MNSKILWDKDHGVTQKSLEFFREHKDELGVVICVACGEFKGPEWGWRTVITGTKATMILSGLSCGYGGEGPHGLYELLQDLGLEGRPFGQTDIHKLDRIVYMTLRLPEQ